MEEARQHSALSVEKKAFIAVFAAGLLAIAIGILLQILLGTPSLHIAAILFAISRAAGTFWQAISPESAAWRQPSRVLAGLWAAFWLSCAVGLSLPFWAY